MEARLRQRQAEVAAELSTAGALCIVDGAASEHWHAAATAFLAGAWSVRDASAVGWTRMTVQRIAQVQNAALRREWRALGEEAEGDVSSCRLLWLPPPGTEGELEHALEFGFRPPACYAGCALDLVVPVPLLACCRCFVVRASARSYSLECTASERLPGLTTAAHQLLLSTRSAFAHAQERALHCRVAGHEAIVLTDSLVMAALPHVSAGTDGLPRHVRCLLCRAYVDDSVPAPPGLLPPVAAALTTPAAACWDGTRILGSGEDVPVMHRTRGHGSSEQRVYYVRDSALVLPECVVDVQLHSASAPMPAPCAGCAAAEAAAAAVAELPSPVQSICRALGPLLSLAPPTPATSGALAASRVEDSATAVTPRLPAPAEQPLIDAVANACALEPRVCFRMRSV